MPVTLPLALEAIRQAAVPVAKLGVPAHVTLLYPFIPPGRIQAADVTLLRAVLGAEPAFDLRLTAVRTFAAAGGSPGTTYLVPEPAAPFERLTRSIWRASPDHPPYEGAYDVVIPHLTIADDAAREAAVELVAGRELPIRRRVSEAWLIVEGDDGRWARRARLALGRPRARPARAGR